MNNDLKRAAAHAAAELVADGMVVGLGSGSTLVFAIDRLGQRVRDEGLKFTGVATSFQSHDLAVKYNIPLLDPMDMSELDLAIDGADEIDPAGYHLKGGGAAQVRERIVASAARRYLVVADESKLVRRLGERGPVVCEVVVPALASAMRRFRELCGMPIIRTGGGKLGPVISDLGNPIVDVKFDGIDDAAKLDHALNAVPGMVGHGLFVGLASAAIIARDRGADAIVETISF